MTAKNLREWLKSTIDCGDGIAVGAIDGNKERYIGVYDRPRSGNARVCIGGIDQTRTETQNYSILVHWTRSPIAAAVKAREIYEALLGKSNIDMDGCTIFLVDPGAGPMSINRDENGVCEYVIELMIITEKE